MLSIQTSDLLLHCAEPIVPPHWRMSASCDSLVESWHDNHAIFLQSGRFPQVRCSCTNDSKSTYISLHPLHSTLSISSNDGQACSILSALIASNLTAARFGTCVIFNAQGASSLKAAIQRAGVPHHWDLGNEMDDLSYGLAVRWSDSVKPKAKSSTTKQSTSSSKQGKPPVQGSKSRAADYKAGPESKSARASAK